MITFTISLKEEIAKNDFNIIEARCELEGFLNSVAKFNKNEISITLENASIARRIYKELKEIYNVNVSVIIRIQKRFKVKQIYILTVKEKIKFIKESIKLDNKVKLEKFVTEEEKVTKGQTIGTVGNTASFEVADSPHLHFEILKDSESLDPKQVIKY